jgi:DNA polymerase elongation subunit (family B)
MLKKLIENLTCSHRHSIETHPACFASGNVNEDKARKIEEEYGKPWYQFEDLRIGYLDIESDGLKSDFATMLSWCIKEKDGPVYFDTITKKELFENSSSPDKRLVQSCIDEMKKYAIIVTYYGTIFDLTFLRAKALHYDLWFPGYTSEQVERSNGEVYTKSFPDLYHFDLYYLCKSKLASLSSKRLENVCYYLNIPGKTPLDKSTWNRAKYGDSEALSEVLAHNVGDVEILEKLHNKLSPFARFTRKSV